MGMKTKGQTGRRCLGFKLLIIFQTVKLWWCYISYSQSWNTQSWSGMRLLVYIEAYNKSVYIWTYTLEALWFVEKLSTFFLGSLRMGEDTQKPVTQSVVLGRWESWFIFLGSPSGKQYFSGKIIALSLKNKSAGNLETGVKQRNKDLSLNSFCSSPVLTLIMVLFSIGWLQLEVAIAEVYLPKGYKKATQMILHLCRSKQKLYGNVIRE